MSDWLRLWLPNSADDLPQADVAAMSGHPKGAEVYRVIDGSHQTIQHLIPIPLSAFKRVNVVSLEPSSGPSVWSEKLPDGEYYLIDGKWVRAEDIKP